MCSFFFLTDHATSMIRGSVPRAFPVSRRSRAIYCLRVQDGGRLNDGSDVTMKRVTLVCKTCGNEEKIEIVTGDDREERPRSTRPASSSMCGRERVELRD